GSMIESDDEEMMMFVQSFKRFFKKENSTEKGPEIKNKEETQKNSSKRPQKLFKKAMKALGVKLLMRNRKKMVKVHDRPSLLEVTQTRMLDS
ncbi:hypothetical protein HAX54_009801, partial [Datura stramonium]|nr:hypothetical protein [Datura stramonium]